CWLLRNPYGTLYVIYMVFGNPSIGVYMSRRVVVTGIGMVSPVGLTAEESWTNIKNGKSGIGHITRFDASNFGVKIAAEVKNWQPEKYIPAKEVRRRDLYQQFVAAAAQEAMRDSGLEVNRSEERRVR